MKTPYTTVNYTAAPAVSSVVPQKVFAQGGKLFVHTGSDFLVIAQVGSFGSVAVDSAYPKGAFAAKNTDWATDHTRVAAYAAQAINAYPVLQAQLQEAQRVNAALLAKLAQAKALLENQHALSRQAVLGLGTSAQSVVQGGVH